MSNSLRARLEEVRRKLSENDRIVCAVLSEEQIKSFERENGVRLPEDYRAFLQIVANGVTVREEIYEIFPLDHWFHENEGMPRNLGKLIRGDLRQPFPLTEAVDFEEEGYPEEGEGPAADGTAPGKVFVSDEGCGTYWILVVTGPERGNMWVEDEFGYQPTNPRIGFLEWCEHWADVGWSESLLDVLFSNDEDA